MAIRTASILATAIATLLATTTAHAGDAGTVDSTFGSNGTVLTAFDIGDVGFDEGVRVLAGSGGLVYNVGRAIISDGDNTFGDTAIAIARYRHNGKLDESYGDGGRVVYMNTDYEWLRIEDATLDNAGRLIVTGRADKEGVIPGALACRFTTEGKIDLSFGNTNFGCFLLSSPNQTHATAITLDENGRIFLAGMSSWGPIVMSLTPDGLLNDSFGDSGTQIFADSQVSRYLDIALDNDNNLIAAGWVQDGAVNIGLITRMDAETGELDEDFAPSGSRFIDFGTQGTGCSTIQSVAITGNNSLLFGGMSYQCGDAEEEVNSFLIGRLNPDGTLAKAFGSDGFAVLCDTQMNPCGSIDDIEIIDPKRFQVSGLIWFPDDIFRMYSQRFLSDGEIDKSYGKSFMNVDHIAVPNFDPTHPQAHERATLALQGGRVVIGGYMSEGDYENSDFALARFDHGIKQSFVVTPAASQNGALVPALPFKVDHSDFASFEVIPTLGFVIDSVTGCDGFLIGTTYTTNAVTGSCKVTATFEVAP